MTQHPATRPTTAGPSQGATHESRVPDPHHAAAARRHGSQRADRRPRRQAGGGARGPGGGGGRWGRDAGRREAGRRRGPRRAVLAFVDRMGRVHTWPGLLRERRARCNHPLAVTPRRPSWGDERVRRPAASRRRAVRAARPRGAGSRASPGAWCATGGSSTRAAPGRSATARTAVPDADSVYRIASMTKSFTAATVLLLRDEGRLRLDDPVADHVPALAGWAPPTADSPRRHDPAPADDVGRASRPTTRGATASRGSPSTPSTGCSPTARRSPGRPASCSSTRTSATGSSGGSSPTPPAASTATSSATGSSSRSG